MQPMSCHPIRLLAALLILLTMTAVGTAGTRDTTPPQKHKPTLEARDDGRRFF